MKIFFLITSVDYGGAETQLLYLASELVSQGHECCVCSMRAPQELVKSFEDKDIKVISLDMPKGGITISSIYLLYKAIKNYQPDIVHSHMIHANLMSRFIRIFLRFKLVNTAHNVYEGGKLLEFVLKSSDFLCESTTQVSPEGLERYIEQGLFKEHKSCFMKNAVKLPEITESKTLCDQVLAGHEDDFVFLSIGRLEPVKDYKNLLDAISLIKHENVFFVIAGRGFLLDELQDYAVLKNVDKKVKFLGARNDIDQLIASADAFVMSSKYEGLPISLLECMAQGLPVVSTEVGAIPNLIKTEINGFLVKPEDSVELAKAIDLLVELSEEKIQQMSAYSRTLIKEQFSSTIIAKEWLTLYSNLL
nr:glycosyltransferase [uncultured Vibrio sp.]